MDKFFIGTQSDVYDKGVSDRKILINISKCLYIEESEDEKNKKQYTYVTFEESAINIKESIDEILKNCFSLGDK